MQEAREDNISARPLINDVPSAKALNDLGLPWFRGSCCRKSEFPWGGNSFFWEIQHLPVFLLLSAQMLDHWKLLLTSENGVPIIAPKYELQI